MSEHKQTGPPNGQATGTVVVANAKVPIWKRWQLWAAAFAAAVIAAGTVVYLVHRHDRSNLAQSSGSISAQQQDIANDTTNSAKIADLLALGSMYQSQGNIPKAVASYKQAEALDTNAFSAPRSLFELYAAQHDRQNATTYGKKAVGILTAHSDDPYADELSYYQQWLKNVQAGNFQAPKTTKDPNAV